MSQNTTPFYFDSWAPPQNCVARPEAQRLLQRVTAGSRVFVDGPRRCGKTTLVLNTLEEAGIPVVRIDLSGVETEQSMIERILTDLEMFLHDHPDFAPEQGSKTTKGGLSGTLGFLTVNLERETSAGPAQRPNSLDAALALVSDVARNCGAAVFVDEFQALKSARLEHPSSTLGAFAAASDPARTRHGVSWIFAGSNRYSMHRIFGGNEGQFFLRTDPICVGPISKEMIVPFLNSRLGEGRLSKALGGKAYDWCEGIPGYLQRLYGTIADEHGHTARRLTEADLEAAQDEVLRSLGRSYALDLRSCPVDALRLLDLIGSRDIRSMPALREAITSIGLNVKDAHIAFTHLLRSGHLSMQVASEVIERPDPMLFHYIATTPAIHHRESAFVGHHLLPPDPPLGDPAIDSPSHP